MYSQIVESYNIDYSLPISMYYNANVFTGKCYITQKRSYAGKIIAFPDFYDLFLFNGIQ